MVSPQNFKTGLRPRLCAEVRGLRRLGETQSLSLSFVPTKDHYLSLSPLHLESRAELAASDLTIAGSQREDSAWECRFTSEHEAMRHFQLGNVKVTDFGLSEFPQQVWFKRQNALMVGGA